MFTQKKISQAQGLPEIIKAQRLKEKLTLEEVSLKTGITLKYLEAIERGYYHLLPGEIYLQQFIKKLADFFKLNEKMLLAIHQKEKESQPALITIKDNKKNAVHNSWLAPFLIKRALISVMLLALAGYLGLEVKNIFTPPELAINSPSNQTVTTEATVEIEGQTKPESKVEINQQKIPLEPNGSFKQKVDLTIGLNIFTISSAKPHSKARVQTISIMRQASETAGINLKSLN